MTDGSTRRRAAAARATLAAAGVELPAWMRLHDLAGAEVAPRWPIDAELALWDALGSAHEAAIADPDRRRRGAHFTPRWLADGLTALVVDRPDLTVLDPACGGGAFLLAALDRLVELGASERDAVVAVRGIDLDPLSAAVAEACVWTWAVAHGHEPGAGDIAIDVGDGLLGPVVGPVDVVVGNPPFLGQLRATTSRDRCRAERLRERFGPAIGPYTDESALFLLAALDLAREGGSVALLQPRSVLASRDAGAVRTAIVERGALESLWLDAEPVFGAEVRVCAPVMHKGPAADVSVLRGSSFTPITIVPDPDPASWGPLAAAADDGAAPPVRLAPGPTVGEVADVAAGFRDEYYALVGAVSEHDGDIAAPGRPRLVTSGAIDLADLRWGRHPSRFAKRRWDRPIVDLDAIADDRVRGWVRDRLVPKVLVATQTRVIECVVDVDGTLLGSVPVLSVEPSDDVDPWSLAAVLAAPGTAAWLWARTAGTARSIDALKVSAADLRAVPLPESVPDEAVDALQAAHRCTDPRERRRLLLAFGSGMAGAQGVGDEVVAWWADRLSVR